MDVKKCVNGHFFDADKYQLCPHCGASVEAKVEFTDDKREVKNESSRQFPWKKRNHKKEAEVTPMPQKTMGKTFSVFDEPPKPLPQSKVVKSTPVVSQKPVAQKPMEPVEKTNKLYTPSDVLVQCPKCGNQTSDTSRFCRYCGAAVDISSQNDNKQVEKAVAENYDPQRDIFSNSRTNDAGDSTEPLQNNTPQDLPPVDLNSEIKQPEPVAETVAPEIKEEKPKESLEAAVRNAVSASEGKTIGFFSMGTSETSIKSEPVVGWIVCIKGEHFGESFNISAGRNSVGRAPINKIVISNDNAVSREKHLWITYDPKHREFFIQPGESSGLTYLNDESVMEYRKLKAKDIIEFGKGSYIFVPLCDKDFSWEEYL